jgi:hypothetical protein
MSELSDLQLGWQWYLMLWAIQLDLQLGWQWWDLQRELMLWAI